jgi:hypothetical protein
MDNPSKIQLAFYIRFVQDRNILLLEMPIFLRIKRDYFKLKNAYFLCKEDQKRENLWVQMAGNKEMPCLSLHPHFHVQCGAVHPFYFK